MNQIIEIVLPVFCLIGIGYAIARFRILNGASGDGLADYVFKIAVPVLLMRSIATADFSGQNSFGDILSFWAVYFSGVFVVWVAAWLWISKVFSRGARAASIAGVAAGFSNLVLLGIPLMEQAYGRDGLQVLFILIAVHLPIMMTVSTFLMELAVRADGVDKTALNAGVVFKNLLLNFAKNPIIIGILVGIALRFSGIGIAGVPDQVVGLIAKTTGPLALISLGMGLIKYGVKGNIVAAVGLTALSLIVLPLTVFIAGTYIFQLPSLWLKVAVLAAASPTGVNAYLFATYFKVAEGLASSSIVLTMLGSILTLPLWLTLLG